jgi:hypothetical protein
VHQLSYCDMKQSISDTPSRAYAQSLREGRGCVVVPGKGLATKTRAGVEFLSGGFRPNVTMRLGSGREL